MELIDHTLKLNGRLLQDAKATTAVDFCGEALESADLVIIRSSGIQLTQYTNGKNEHIVEQTSHVSINGDGLVQQFIPFNRQVSEPIPGSWEGIKDLRSRAIVINFENCGRLSKKAEHFVSACEKTFDTAEVFTGIHQNEESLSYWHKFSESQIQIAEKIIRCLTSTYQVKYILGNEEVCPGLKTDPGPAFPLEILRRKVIRESRLFGLDNSMELNIANRFDLNTILGRQHQSDEQGKDAKIVNIRKKSGGWYKVNIDLGGFIKEEWVSI
ncbi:MAG: hypothetical protein WBA74_01450 [Cyclobacteriaceae bacterium]